MYREQKKKKKKYGGGSPGDDDYDGYCGYLGVHNNRNYTYNMIIHTYI